MRAPSRILLTLLLTAIAVGVEAQISIGRRPLTYDAAANRYLCAVPQGDFFQPFSATVALDPDSAWTGVRIDNTPATDGSEVAFPTLDGTTVHRLAAIRRDGTAVDAELMFTSLPILRVNASLSEEYQPAVITLIHPDSTRADTMTARIKWRGSTTLMDSRHKRNFHIKFVDSQGKKQDRALLGMRNDNSWLLDAGQIDPSRIRNLAANRLWLDYARKPYYADLEPKARSGIRGELIEVILNDKYEGVYTLFEAMDRKQLKLEKYDENTGEFHGMLWKAQRRDLVTRFAETNIPTDDNLAQWGGFDVKYPDPDEVMPTHWNTLYQAVDLIANKPNTLVRRDAPQLIDLPVMADYYILVYLLHAIDNHAKNLFYACYDVGSQARITLAPWDLDCTVGQDWTNSPYRPENRIGPEANINIGNGLFTRLNDNMADFRADVNSRYGTLRRTTFREDSLVARYHTLIDRLIDAGAAAREAERWSGDSDLGGQALDFENEKRYIADWIHRRLILLDTVVFPNSAVEDVAAPAEPAVYYDLTGRMVSERPLPAGIYITSRREKICVNR